MCFKRILGGDLKNHLLKDKKVKLN